METHGNAWERLTEQEAVRTPIPPPDRFFLSAMGLKMTAAKKGGGRGLRAQADGARGGPPPSTVSGNVSDSAGQQCRSSLPSLASLGFHGPLTARAAATKNVPAKAGAEISVHAEQGIPGSTTSRANARRAAVRSSRPLGYASHCAPALAFPAKGRQAHAKRRAIVVSKVPLAKV